MRTLPVLLIALAFAPSLRADDVAIPANARQVFAENGWQILLESEIVPGTEKFRAQSFTRTYYCGKIGARKARIVFEERGTGSHLNPLRIAPDGTMVASVYSNKLLFVGPDDLPAKVGDGVALMLPDQKSKETVILHASAAGLVVHPAELNKPVPIYFISLDGKKPVTEKTVELCTRDANSLHRTRTGFHVSDKWIVWDSGSYEVATGKIRKRVAESGVVDDLAIDGDLVVTQRRAVVEKKGVYELVAIDLKTGAPNVRYPLASNSRFVASRDEIAYVLNPGPLDVGDKDRRPELLALDLGKQVEPLSKTKLAELPEMYAPVRITPKGFAIRDFTAEWVKK